MKDLSLYIKDLQFDWRSLMMKFPVGEHGLSPALVSLLALFLRDCCSGVLRLRFGCIASRDLQWLP